jgi:hypothetical protein
MVEVGKADLTKARKMREEMDDTSWFTAESGKGKNWGTNYVRVLPPHIKMEGLFYWSVPIHFKVGPGQQNLPCPRRAKLGGCPICARGFELRLDGQEDEFRALMPSFQAYMNVVKLDKDGTPAEDPPRVRTWSVSKRVLDMLLDEFEEAGDFTDLEEGRNIEVKRRGQGFDTEYRIRMAEPSKVTYLGVVEEMRDLQTVSPFVDGETLLKALDAPAAGGDPWTPPAGQLAEGSGAKTGEVLPAGSFTDEPEAEESQGAPGGEAPATSDEKRDEAREHLRKAVAPKTDGDK